MLGDDDVVGERLQQGTGRVTVLGAGGWGTALALVFARRGHDVVLWCRRRSALEEIAAAGENRRYLPGHPLHANISLSDDLEKSVRNRDIVVIAVPVQHIRQTLAPIADSLGKSAIRLGAAKGFERFSLLRVSQLLNEIWGEGPYAVLTGPSFAAEVAQGQPTAVTVASESASVADKVKAAVSSDLFGISTSSDVIGVEVAGALKNVIAIAVGMVRGLGFGANTVAVVLTHGLAEIRQLGLHLGGRSETFQGLAGMGDLVLTGTGPLSRNAHVGEALAQGRQAADSLGDPGMVAEGIETTRSAVALAEKSGISMPIASEVAAVLFNGREPKDAVRRLMLRALKME